ncbi:MAG TPA: glycosyltransferase family 4 protein [Planctomycetota bacterium]|nr:glycosyltransferase family 4 protein [Planctomycetota bacterium]
MRLKVGIYTAAYPGVNGAGGIATYTESLALGLVQLGHEVHVLTLGDETESHRIKNVHIHFARKKYLGGLERWIPGAREAWAVSARARELAREHQLDIFEFPNWEGRGAFFKYGFGAPPMVVRLHTSLEETLALEKKSRTLGQRFECALERAACLRADALYVSTRAHRTHMAEELRIPEARMSVLPLGIPDVSESAARQPRPRGKTPIVLCLGRLERRKGSATLLQAVPEIVKHCADVQIIFAGKDRSHAPGNVTHQEYFAKNFPSSLQRNVVFNGFTSDADLRDLFQRADVLVAPSLYESFGLIFIEAMRWSVPVIGTRVGGIPEIITDGVDGVLVPPASPPHLAEAIVRVLSDEPLRLRLAHNGRQTYEQRFTHHAMAARTAAYFQSIIAAPVAKGAVPRPLHSPAHWS